MSLWDSLRAPKSFTSGLCLFLLCFPLLAFGHPLASERGFVAGLLHPVFGLDHFLAMLSVGIVSAQLGGYRIYTVPAVFVCAMTLGAIAGVYGQAWPYTEVGIASSVIFLGLGIVFVSRESPGIPIMMATAFFGALHGHAHGLEMPNAIDPVFYAGGFLLSTAAIHMLGVGVGHVMTNPRLPPSILRHLGSGAAGMGLVILFKTISGL